MPKGTPRWQMLLPYFEGHEPDTVIAIDDVIQATQFSERQIRMSMPRVRSVLLDTELRELVAVPGVGYRIAAAREHVDIAERLRDGAHKKIRRAKASLDGTRLDELTSKEREVWRKTTETVAMHERILAQHAERLEAVERAIEKIKHA